MLGSFFLLLPDFFTAKGEKNPAVALPEVLRLAGERSAGSPGLSDGGSHGTLLPSSKLQAQPALSCLALQQRMVLGGRRLLVQTGVIFWDSTPAAWVMAWDEFSSC